MTAALFPTPSGRAAASAIAAVLLVASIVVAAPPNDRGHPAMNEPGRQPLIASYYEQLGRDGDFDAFLARVEARYSEATLARLVDAEDVRARRGAVTALGLVGGFESNAAIGSALADDDPVVRDLASKALWSIWFRADSPENNDRLRDVSGLIGRGLLDEAHRRATELIARAPEFAEAYNQRAIASFFMGNIADSAADCRRALELNPYHFGALDGLAGCYLKLGQTELALETYRRSLEIQPHNEAIRRNVEALESGLP